MSCLCVCCEVSTKARVLCGVHVRVSVRVHNIYGQCIIYISPMCTYNIYIANILCNMRGAKQKFVFQEANPRLIFFPSPLPAGSRGRFSPPAPAGFERTLDFNLFSKRIPQSVSSNFALVRAAGSKSVGFGVSESALHREDARCERRQTVHQVRQERQEGEDRGQVSAPYILVPSNLALALQVPYLPWKKSKQRPKETQRQQQQPTSLLFQQPKKT